MTKKKTRYKSAPLNACVTLVCLTLCGASLWLFYNDLTSSSSRTDKDQVATITFKHRIAQRKYNDRVVWERLAQNSPLYNGDTIHTADMSDATINFANGAAIEVDENSMVQLSYAKDGTLKISVSGGKVSADTTNSTQPLVLDMGGKVVNVQSGAKVSAALDQNGDVVGVKVLAGNAAVGDSEIAAGQSVKVFANGEIVESPVTVTSVAENQNFFLFDKPASQSAVPLEWISSESNKKIIVETSATKDFAVIKDSFTVKDKNKVNLPTSDGVLYWRVYPEGDVQNASQGKLNFAKIPPVQAVATQDVFSYYQEKPFVTLSWNGSEYAQKYKVEVSEYKDFSKVLVERETTSQTLTLNDLPDGKYFWRVTPCYQNAYTMPSTAKSFSVARKEKLQPPELTFPPDQNKIAYTENKFQMDFAWQAENLGGEYTLQIARDKGFTDLIVSQRTTEKSLHQTLSVYEFPKGEYYWNVYQTFGGKNYVSQTRCFSIEKYTPEQNRLLFPDDSYSVGKGKLNALSFVWKISKENNAEFADQKTVLQFSKTKDFLEIALAKETDDITAKNINLEQGKYFWRVVKGTSQSDTRSIYVLGELATPTITAPAVDKKFVFAKNQSPSVPVNWRKTPGADFYKLQLIDSTTNKVVQEISSLTKESANVSVKPTQEEKKFVVQVQAFTNETKLSASRKSQAAKSSFIVRAAPPDLPPAVLIEPYKNQRIGAAYLEKNRSVTFTWRAVNGATEYDFVLYQKTANGSLRKIHAVQATKNTQVKIRNLKILDIGNFQWQVTARNKPKDGSYIQNGKTAIQNFSIYFEMPGKVDALDPGEIYGE